MTISERLSPCVEINCGGKRRRILFTHAALIEIEDLTGKDVMGGEANLFHPSITLLRAALFATLRRTGWKLLTLRMAGDLISSLGLSAAGRIIAEGWIISAPDPDKFEAEDPDAPKAKAHSWTEAWASARDLGLSDREWLDMTPRLVQAMSLQRLANMRQRELMLSKMIAMNANYSYWAPKKPFRHDAFMLHPWPTDIGDEVERAFEQLENKSN